MARLFNWFSGQLVTQQDMRTSDLALERGDRDVLADHDTCGLIDGFEVTAQSPPQLGVRIAGGLGYTMIGARVKSEVALDLDLSITSDGYSSAVSGPANKKILSVFAVQDRDGSDPRLDGTNTVIYYRQDEAVQIVVVGGAEDPVSPTPPLPLPDAILLADVTFVFGQVVVVAGDISYARVQHTLRLEGAPFGLGGTGGIYGTYKQGIQAIVSRYNALINGTGDTISGASVPYGGSGPWVNGVTGLAAGTLESGIDGVVAALASTTTSTSGGDRIGVAADGTSPTIVASSLTARLGALRLAGNLIYLNGPPWLNFITNPTVTLQDRIDTIIVDLSAIVVTGRGTGGQKIGMSSLGNFTATSVHGYFQELVAVTSGEDGARRVGATAAGGFSGLNVRAQLNELMTGKVNAASPTFTGTVTSTGPMVCSSTLAVTGASTLTGAVSCGAALGVTGATTLSSTLAVTGAVTCTAALSVGTTLACAGAATVTGALTVNGTASLLGRKVILRPRYACPDANQTIDVTMADRFVLPSPGAPRVVVLKHTAPAVPTANETLDLICHNLTGAGIQYTFTREDGTVVVTFVGSALSFTSPCWAQVEYAGGVWTLGPNSGSSYDGSDDYRVLPGAGA